MKELTKNANKNYIQEVCTGMVPNILAIKKDTIVYSSQKYLDTIFEIKTSNGHKLFTKITFLSFCDWRRIIWQIKWEKK